VTSHRLPVSRRVYEDGRTSYRLDYRAGEELKHVGPLYADLATEAAALRVLARLACDLDPATFPEPPELYVQKDTTDPGDTEDP